VALIDLERIIFEHFVHKGKEAAQTCADTLHKIRAIRRNEPRALAV